MVNDLATCSHPPPLFPCAFKVTKLQTSRTISSYLPFCLPPLGGQSFTPFALQSPSCSASNYTSAARGCMQLWRYPCTFAPSFFEEGVRIQVPWRCGRVSYSLLPHFYCISAWAMLESFPVMVARTTQDRLLKALFYPFSISFPIPVISIPALYWCTVMLSISPFCMLSPLTPKMKNSHRPPGLMNHNNGQSPR